MKKKPLFILIGLLAVLLFAAASTAYARLDGYTISWWTVDGGGGASSENGYSLSGTIGQPDAGTVATGGAYTWQAGSGTAARLPRNRCRFTCRC